MRKIKFRAWNKKTGTMLGIVLSICWVDSFHCSKEIHVRSPYPHPNTYPLDDIILMQFTGLKDKNGVEIYEGDILSHKFYSRPVQVFYKDACFHAEDVSLFSSGLEVVGNIWEDKGLLDDNK